MFTSKHGLKTLLQTEFMAQEKTLNCGTLGPSFERLFFLVADFF